jgi:NADH-quinone oxidoreductase subunit F
VPSPMCSSPLPVGHLMSPAIMNNHLSLVPATAPPHVQPGPLLTAMMDTASGPIEGYIQRGGYSLAKKIVQERDQAWWLRELESSGLRGRGGGAFPTAHKWWLVQQRECNGKAFICNVNSGHSGGLKEAYLLALNPHFLVEATLIATYLTGASDGFICVSGRLSPEKILLESALRDAYSAGFIGTNAFGSGITLNVYLYTLPDLHIAGEETAILEWMEGHVPRPRGKPPLLSASGLNNKPTAVNNLETVLQAHYALKVGAERYHRMGTRLFTGTMVFSLTGHVERPGLYELPLGISFRELLEHCGQGMTKQGTLKGFFPGGETSAVLGPECLDVCMDYRSIRKAGSELGTGEVIVFGDQINAVDLARHLASFFYNASCGKCQPCKDGLERSTIMLNSLEKLSQPAVDLSRKVMPASPRATLNILNNGRAGVSYTDTVEGLDKITHLAEWYKHRGDCRHSQASSLSIQKLITSFRAEFEQSRTSDKSA